MGTGHTGGGHNGGGWWDHVTLDRTAELDTVPMINK